jgi:hypothetical protein
MGCKSSGIDVLFHYLMLRLQGPHAVLITATQAGGWAVRQLDVELVGALVVAKLDDVDAQALVAGEAVPDADLGQQSGDEDQVAFVVLHHLFALGVFTHQVEEEVLACKVMAAAQDTFDDLRHRLMLVDAQLLAATEQCQARLQGDFIAGFIVGPGQTFETGDHAMQSAQRFDFRDGQTLDDRWLLGSAQAKTGVPSQQLFGGDVLFGAGEFHRVGEGLAQAFFTLKSEDVEWCFEIADPQFVAAVVEENS